MLREGCAEVGGSLPSLAAAELGMPQRARREVRVGQSTPQRALPLPLPMSPSPDWIQGSGSLLVP